MGERKSSLKIVLHSLINFIVLIVSLIILNVLLSSIHNNTYIKLVEFLNSLLGLFIILFLIGMVNSLFWNFEFPLNLLAPISGAVLGLFIVDLIYEILEFTQTFVYFDILENILAYPISLIVFFATFIIGYLIIFTEENNKAEKHPKEEHRKKEIKERKKSSKTGLTWEDIGQEFRKVFLNIGKALNSAFEGKHKKIKR